MCTREVWLGAGEVVGLKNFEFKTKLLLDLNQSPIQNEIFKFEI